ncbi:hypothetical protein QL285_083036 [Trifolium repens]|nr:hypothetical protein QL285_083036 [Trifolium repens]
MPILNQFLPISISSPSYLQFPWLRIRSSPSVPREELSDFRCFVHILHKLRHIIMEYTDTRSRVQIYRTVSVYLKPQNCWSSTTPWFPPQVPLAEGKH